MKITWENFPNLDNRLLEVAAEAGVHHSGPGYYDRIAAVLTNEFRTIGKTFTGDMVRNRLKRVQYTALGSRPATVLMPHFQIHADIITGTQPAPDKLVQGRTWQEYIETVMLNGTRKTLVLSDLHIPTQHDKAIDFAVRRNLTADLIIINGDLLDLYSVSGFIKPRDIPIYEELDGAIRFLTWISDLFPNTFILLTRGNHEQRLYTKVVPHLPSGLQFVAKLDLLDTLARPFPNVMSVNDWFVAVGDAIYAHSDATSAIPGKPAQTTGEWFLTHMDELGLTTAPRFVVQGHTHRVSAVYTHNQKCVESGCLCNHQDYARTTRYKVPQGLGYVTALQYNGVTDLQNSREYAFVPSELETLGVQ